MIFGGGIIAIHYPGTLASAVYGSPDRQALREYFCPVCGTRLAEGDVVAEDKDGNTVGCVYCVRYYEIWEKF